MSKRLDILYNYIKRNIPDWKEVSKISDDCFCYYYKINGAFYSLDLVCDNVTVNSNNSEIVNHFYNHPKAKVYTYISTVNSVMDPFNGKRIYGEEFSGEIYELFQDQMVRLHFEKINLTEIGDILYVSKALNDTKEA